jgi:hypothetical protein
MGHVWVRGVDYHCQRVWGSRYLILQLNNAIVAPSCCNTRGSEACPSTQHVHAWNAISCSFHARFVTRVLAMCGVCVACALYVRTVCRSIEPAPEGGRQDSRLVTSLFPRAASGPAPRRSARRLWCRRLHIFSHGFGSLLHYLLGRVFGCGALYDEQHATNTHASLLFEATPLPTRIGRAAVVSYLCQLQAPTRCAPIEGCSFGAHLEFYLSY